MFLRVTRGSSDPAKHDDLLALTDDFVAANKRLPGFVSYQSGIDPGTGAFVVITAWETADAARFPRDALGDVLQRLSAAGARPDSSEIYEQIVRIG
jgi:quinol monooxygenase YgiN